MQSWPRNDRVIFDVAQHAAGIFLRHVSCMKHRKKQPVQKDRLFCISLIKSQRLLNFKDLVLPLPNIR